MQRRCMQMLLLLLQLEEEESARIAEKQLQKDLRQVTRICRDAIYILAMRN